VFDWGLWTAEQDGDDFIAIVANGRFRDSSPSGRLLGVHHEKPLHFPEDAGFRPDPLRFAWHRRYRFAG